jgi:hypothetical protein
MTSNPPRRKRGAVLTSDDEALADLLEQVKADL